MKRGTLITLIIIGALLAAAIIYSIASGGEKERILEAEVERGNFEILVTVTGELQAERSTEINAPLQLRSRRLRIRDVKIQDLVPEGTLVDSGDYVATLDRSEADNTLKDIMDQVEQEQSRYDKTRIDTTIQLRELRDQLINLKFAVEEAKIKLEQSEFEPPATIRQAQIDLDKAERAYEQAKKNYKLKVERARADMTDVAIELAEEHRRMEEMQEVLENFIIKAPSPGMVIYKKEWSGQKRTVGSTVQPWDLTVATLPDLSSMVSRTYVNEIDIRKIKKGQQVRIGVDAFPEKSYTGVVDDVANIGEQLPNTDAKVFEVTIKLNEYDSILRPSMTTSNMIVTDVYKDVLHIPLEAVHSNDSISWVYKKNHTKQVVMLGAANENQIILEKGLEEGERVLLSKPSDAEDYKLRGEELIPEIIARKEAPEDSLRQEQGKRKTSESPRTRRRRVQQ